MLEGQKERRSDRRQTYETALRPGTSICGQFSLRAVVTCSFSSAGPQAVLESWPLDLLLHVTAIVPTHVFSCWLLPHQPIFFVFVMVLLPSVEVSVRPTSPHALPLPVAGLRLALAPWHLSPSLPQL